MDNQMLYNYIYYIFAPRVFTRQLSRNINDIIILRTYAFKSNYVICSNRPQPSCITWLLSSKHPTSNYAQHTLTEKAPYRTRWFRKCCLVWLALTWETAVDSIQPWTHLYTEESREEQINAPLLEDKQFTGRKPLCPRIAANSRHAFQRCDTPTHRRDISLNSRLYQFPLRDNVIYIPTFLSSVWLEDQRPDREMICGAAGEAKIADERWPQTLARSRLSLIAM